MIRNASKVIRNGFKMVRNDFKLGRDGLRILKIGADYGHPNRLAIARVVINQGVVIKVEIGMVRDQNRPSTDQI